MDKLAFYLQKNNKLFKGNVLVVGYEADAKEIKTFGLTSKTVTVFIKSNLLQEENILTNKS